MRILCCYLALFVNVYHSLGQATVVKDIDVNGLLFGEVEKISRCLLALNNNNKQQDTFVFLLSAVTQCVLFITGSVTHCATV